MNRPVRGRLRNLLWPLRNPRDYRREKALLFPVILVAVLLSNILMMCNLNMIAVQNSLFCACFTPRIIRFMPYPHHGSY